MSRKQPAKQHPARPPVAKPRSSQRQPISVTPGGFKALAITAALLPAGILFAMPELIALAIFPPMLMLVVAVWWVLDRSSIVATRMSPASCHVDESISNTVQISAGRRRTGVLRLHDVVDNTAEEPTLFAAIASGQSASLRTQHRPSRRGHWTWGPTAVFQVDPLGMLVRRRFFGAEGTTIVRPKVHALATQPYELGQVDQPEHSRQFSLTRRNEELSGLRPYQPGDDIRHVHWAAVARTGTIVVRQFEQAEHQHTLIVLDDRSSVHTQRSFERAIEAAASAVVATINGSRIAHFCTSSGFDFGEFDDTGSAGRLLDEMATMAQHDCELSGLLRQQITAWQGLVILCTAGVRGADINRFRRDGGAESIVVVDTAPAQTAALRPADVARTGAGTEVRRSAGDVAGIDGVSVVPFVEVDSFQAAWAAAFRSST